MRSNDSYERTKLINRIIDKLADQDLLKSVDYPNVKDSYEDSYDIISDILSDYKIFQGDCI